MMHNSAAFFDDKIDRDQVTSLAVFVMNNIPDMDQYSLKKFLELMNTGPGSGWVSNKQLIATRNLLLKHNPRICTHSLAVLFEHLEIYLPLNGKENDDFFLIPADKLEKGTDRNGRIMADQTL